MMSFTERERAFVQLACDLRELTYDQIAEEMEVHRRTVDGYRDAVFAVEREDPCRYGVVRAAMGHGGAMNRLRGIA